VDSIEELPDGNPSDLCFALALGDRRIQARERIIETFFEGTEYSFRHISPANRRIFTIATFSPSQNLIDLIDLIEPSSARRRFLPRIIWVWSG
jgi:hypothetical protein